MKEFTKLIDAVAEAAVYTDEWAVLPGKDIIDSKQALARALEIDKGNEEEGMTGRFKYLCSEEGAVGMTMDKEYQAQWFMIPLL
jgi:hypothetical protein